MQQSQMLRLVVVLLLVLLLQIPTWMIGGVIRERRTRRTEAVEDISSKWGRQQIVTGPALVIPYTHRWTEIAAGGLRVDRTEVRHATFLPDRLAFRGKIAGESRSRGIFSVPVYKAMFQVAGEFSRPRFRDWNVPDGDIQWDKAQLAVGISDVRAIQERPTLAWNQQALPFQPGTGAYLGAVTGVHATVGDVSRDSSLAFSFPLDLNGSVGAYFTPFGGKTTVDLESNWGSPSFQGNWLPARRTVSDQGFQASWSIPYLGRNYPQSWLAGTVSREALDASRFGVDLISPVDEHRMADRSVKYAGLFILLTFAAIWLTEVLGRMRVHPIQYLLVGAALCLFYLLELSLSEHVGFGVAYLLATAAIVGMVSAYSLAVLRTRRRALVIGTMVAALYGYLYVLLNNEDYALLVGSIGLFAILAAIMYLTRRTDWYAAASPESPRAG